MHERFFRGFTIVELVIVISVIGILASITIVGYKGVNNRAYDNAVRDDLNKFSDTINIYYSDNTRYPTSSAELQTLTSAKFSKSNYLTTQNSVAYCVGGTTNGQAMAMIGTSKSGSSYYTLNDDTVKPLGATTFPTNASTVCQNLGVSGATVIWVHSTASGWMKNV
jgi:prepilin-type N-terminal cleavage/methylation domain-containing protein